METFSFNENYNEQKSTYTNIKQNQSSVNCGPQDAKIRQKIITCQYKRS